MSDEDQDEWREGVPDSEKLDENSRISDSAWDDLVGQIAQPSAGMSEIPVEEVREALEEDEGWEPEPAAPVGWRTAPPTLVLSLVSTLGAVVLLLIGVVFFRPVPGWYLLVGVAVGLGGAVGLFFHLPKYRSIDGDNGASV